MRIHRYTPWDGSQEIRFPTPNDLLKHLSDTFLEEEGVRRALRSLMRRGFESEDGRRSVQGLREILQQAEAKKEELLNWYSPDSFRLSPEERTDLSRKLNELTGKIEGYYRQMLNFVERLSGRYGQNMDTLAKRLTEVHERHQQLREHLGEQIDQRAMNQPQSLTGPQGGDLSQLLDRLSHLLDDDDFLQNLPGMLDATVEDLDNLLESLDSMSQEHLQGLSDGFSQMEQLEQLLNQYPFQGNQRVGMGEVGEVLGQLRDLEQFLRWGRRGLGDIAALDMEAIRQLLGEEAYEHLKYLQSAEQMMVDGGYVVRTKAGLRLSPRGMRQLGDKALKEIFQLMDKNRWGQHASTKVGNQGSKLEDVQPYKYGTPLNIDIRKTLAQALEAGRGGVPIQLEPQDFHVYQHEFSTDTETVLLIDVSYSMLMNDALHAGKKVALALNRLIETKFPQDVLHLVAFRSNAKIIRTQDLPSIVAITYFMEHGTDIKEAFRFSRQLLGKNRAKNQQIILITDGEPTACNTDQGRRLHSGWGSASLQRRIVRETLKEVQRCTQRGIRINTFMLGMDYYRMGFVDRLTKMNTGRVFYTSPDEIGNYLVVDYLANKRRHLRR
jgi:uncharacterized protein with von Willebrand factor type A (vWA) domain